MKLVEVTQYQIKILRTAYQLIQRKNYLKDKNILENSLKLQEFSKNY
jgi:hypothetical protein